MRSSVPPVHHVVRHQLTGTVLPSPLQAVLSCTSEDQGAIPKQALYVQLKTC